MEKKSKKSCVVIPLILGIIVALGIFAYYMLFHSNFSKFAKFLPGSGSVCSTGDNTTILLVGIDYRAGDYLYGLADVIRIAEVDFSDQKVDMVPLPRDLLVIIPADQFNVQGPMKINQAYFFGTPGMQAYQGGGTGADSLNAVIEYNFGVSADHYVVINFQTFVSFVDTIGGVDVNLPEPVYGGKQGDFPAGDQTLTGERALALARIRENYSDEFRVRNQSLIIDAILEKMLQPAMLLRYPLLAGQFKDTILTDLPLDQLGTLGLCSQGFSRENIQTHQVPPDLLYGEQAFIPSLNEYSFVYRWDARLVEWIQSTLD